MDDKGIQAAIGSKRRKINAGSQTTTLETPKEERATQCGMSLTGELWSQLRTQEVAIRQPGSANAGQRNVGTLVNG